MKKLTLTCLLAAGLSSAVLAQSVFIDLSGNAGGVGALTGGLLYKDTGSGPSLLNEVVNVTLLGSTSLGGVYSPLVTIADGSVMMLFGPGQAYDLGGNSYAIPGLTANTTGYFEAQWWLGSATTYAAAVTAGALHGDSGPFGQLTGGGSTLGNPPTTPPGLTGMPSVVLSGVIVPEPSTIALAGMGAAALLMYRRRK
jgi:hypothetical protein